MNIEQERSRVMSNAREAAAVFTQYSQDAVDRIVKAVSDAGLNNRVRLAKMACEETGIGIWQDKAVKNTVASLYVYEDIKNEKTVGIISEDRKNGIIEIAQPLGPILAVIPVTNPTSTTIFKIMIAMKTRNPIIITPSQKAYNCSVEAARICLDAAMKADAPENCIQWLERPDKPEDHREQTNGIMKHPDLALILATGGSGLVKSAYSSGTPAIGVGAGNVPVFIERTADIPFAVEQIFISKTFDNGTICASEQGIIVEKCVAEKLRAEFEKCGGYFLPPEDVAKLEKIAFDSVKKSMNANIVGRPAIKIARMAGIQVPENVKILMAPLKGVGSAYPLSSEILAPILAYYQAKDFDEALNICIDLNFHGGMGHTASIFSNDDNAIKKFAAMMNAGRIVVNMPSSQGAVGGLFNTIATSFTLGCGTSGKNITTDNITARHLINIQRITKRRLNERMLRFNNSYITDESLNADFINSEFNRNY